MIRGFRLIARDSESRALRQVIAAAITAELERQGHTGGSHIDVDAMAGAIDHALNPPASSAEGKHPDELNATNDD